MSATGITGCRFDKAPYSIKSLTNGVVAPIPAQSYDEGGGAATVVLQNTAEAKGFQIFVVPYTAYQVSMQRFRRDEPSGVMQSPRAVTIDGAAATSFYGDDADLGPTAEVWFIHGGYLYEATAPKAQAAWLSQILSTWKFI